MRSNKAVKSKCTYKCALCAKKFKKEHGLKVHVAKSHPVLSTKLANAPPTVEATMEPIEEHPHAKLMSTVWGEMKGAEIAENVEKIFLEVVRWRRNIFDLQFSGSRLWKRTCFPTQPNL